MSNQKAFLFKTVQELLIVMIVLREEMKTRTTVGKLECMTHYNGGMRYFVLPKGKLKLIVYILAASISRNNYHQLLLVHYMSMGKYICFNNQLIWGLNLYSLVKNKE